MSEKIEITKDTPLNPGDKIEMKFNLYGAGDWYYFRAVQVAAIENRLKKKYKNLDFTGWTDADDALYMRFTVKQPSTDPMENVQEAGIVTGAIIALTVIGGGILTWMVFDKIYKIVDSPAGQIALAGTGAAGIGLLIVVVLVLLSKVKK